MTEQDYILATDKRALDCAIDALAHITPENNPHLKAREFRDVVRWLVETRDGLAVKLAKKG